MAQVAALIGDVIGSRKHPDRAVLQRRLVELLESVTGRVGGRLDMTIGDEFQGAYPSLEDAVRASLLLHLEAGETIRFRIGVGWGDLLVETAGLAPFGQDGPAWWRARAAIEQLAEMSGGARTLVDTDTDWDSMINHFLAMRDALVNGFDGADFSIATGLLAGRTQREIATEVGIHESSVSRRISNRGIGLIVDGAGAAIPGFGRD